MTCPAITAKGSQCTRASIYFEGHCGTHHNSLYNKNADYRARYLAHTNAIPERQRQEEGRRAARFAEEAAQLRAENERRRAAARQRNQEAYENAPNSTPAQILNYARSLFNIWSTAPLQGYDAIRAYIALKYRSSKHVGFDTLIRATVAVVNQTAHPEHPQYTAVPLAERQATLATLVEALVPYGEIRIEELPERDAIHPTVQGRIRREAQAAEAARLRAERHEAQRQQLREDLRLRAAARDQLREDLLRRPVVFQRDPEGSINLRAMAADAESVHRSSVQTTTERAIQTLLQRPRPEGQETLLEVTAAFHERRLVRFSTDAVRERVITEITHDYFETEAFSVKYGDVLDCVWAYIQPHESRRDLIIRLAQEICDGLGTCGNGKMARLINVLRGFDDTIEFDIPREFFQTKFATLRERPIAEREAAATEVFNEFNIPEGERNVWLQPLMEEA